jgi:hypothetical protein
MMIRQFEMTVLDNNLHGDGIKFHDFRAVSSPIALLDINGNGAQR